MFRRSLINFFLLLFLFTVAGCSSGEKAVEKEYTNYKFDQQVIDKLPLYDSLVSAIIASFPSFDKFIKEKDSYRAFRYRPVSEDPDVFIKLPPAAEPKITPYYNRLGKDLIYGFDVFKDSSVKIYIRVRLAAGSGVDIVENLSWYSKGNIRNRAFPEKDTALNTNWQYWARFDKRGLF